MATAGRAGRGFRQGGLAWAGAYLTFLLSGEVLTKRPE